METLLTESMICCFSSSVLLQGSLFRKLSLLEASSGTAGNFRQNGTQLELLGYHAARSDSERDPTSLLPPGTPAGFNQLLDWRNHHQQEVRCWGLGLLDQHKLLRPPRLRGRLRLIQIVECLQSGSAEGRQALG